jgi:Thrombospondin type 3 repeat
MKALLLLPVAFAGLSGCVAYSVPYGAPYGYEGRPGVYAQPEVYVQPGVVYGAPPPGYYQRAPGTRGGRDRDRDGIPDRRDRDRDGDGVPNRYDRQPNNPNWR